MGNFLTLEGCLVHKGIKGVYLPIDSNVTMHSNAKYVLGIDIGGGKF